MSEEEIMQTINDILRSFDFGMEMFTGKNYQHFKSQKQAIQGLLDLYNKEKEKNKRLFYKVITLKNKLSYDIEHINNKLSSNEYINDIRVARLKGIRMKCKEILKYLLKE